VGRRSLDTKRNRTWWIVGGAAAVVVLAAGVVAAVVVFTPPRERTGVVTALIKPDTSVKTVSVPAVFDAWSTNPAVGDGVQADASEAGLAVRVTAGAATPILSQSFAAVPSATYTVSVTYRSGVSDVGVAALEVGGSPAVELPFADEWTTVDFQYTNAGEGQDVLTLLSTGALDGFQMGSISVKTEAGEDVLANGEFDTFSAPSRITNASLFMDTGSAYLGVSAPVSELTWTVADVRAAEVLAGTSPAQSGLALIQLSSLSQGFYTVSMTAPEEGLPATSVNIVVLNDVVPETLDSRLGTIVHLDRPQSKNADVVTQILGFGVVRGDAWWAGNEVAEGVYAFPAALDQIYANNRDRGIEILPIAAYSNKLYDGKKTPSSPKGLAAYANYAAAVVDHYGVGAISIYNEFNHLPFNTGACGPTPACYMELLVPAAEAVRALHPDTLIVGPENAHKDDEFLTGLYQAGGLNYLDVVSFHPYDYGFEENGSPEFLVESLAQAQARIAEYNTDDTPPPIWITELGWTSVLTDSEVQQGDYLIRAEVIALASGVERFFWYNMINDAEAPGDNVSNYGIVHQATAAVPTFEPKPAAASQAIVSRMLAGKSFVGQDAIGPDVYSFRFGEGEEAVVSAWALAPTSVTYEAEGPVRITDATGSYTLKAPVDGLITVELGPSPVFLSSLAHSPTLAG